MNWVSGLRSGILYTVMKRPLDPRWSNEDLQVALAWCATGQHLGWSEERAFQVAEAIVMTKHCPGIYWPDYSLVEDIKKLTCREETT